MQEILLFIVAIGWMIALLVFYHKIFTVYYFDLGHGLLKELVISFFLGAFLAAITFYLWWLTAIIIIVAGLTFKNKFSSNTPLIIAVVLAIIVAIMGICVRKDINDKAAAKAECIEIERELEC